jgi:hypothetical protein
MWVSHMYLYIIDVASIYRINYKMFGICFFNILVINISYRVSDELNY